MAGRFSSMDWRKMESNDSSRVAGMRI